MAWKIEGVAVSDVTRFVSEDPQGTVSSEVTIDLERSEPGPGARVTVNVDMQDGGNLSFSEIESHSIRVALDVLKVASDLPLDDLERIFREKFVDHAKENPAA
jgi:hypothetical protein